MSQIRIAVLYSELAGYTIACLEALKSNYDADVLVFHWPRHVDAPFEMTNSLGQMYSKADYSTAQIFQKIKRFGPTILFVPGWMDRDYLSIARRFKKEGVVTIAGCDSQWKGNMRQQLSRIVSPLILHSAIDILWVSGERQRQFAYRLGYRGTKCLSGFYSCDWPLFSSSMPRDSSPEPSFLYVGRYVEVKGIDLLVAAYREYRKRSESPWKLICIGTGKMQSALENQDGISDIGFIQPSELPGHMKAASCFILPSVQEPWGVVLHEAGASGLPLICSDAVGAAVHLLQDGYNGLLFQSGNIGHLVECMTRLSDLSEESLGKMGERSFELSRQFTPATWSDTLVQGAECFNKNRSSIQIT